MQIVAHMPSAKPTTEAAGICSQPLVRRAYMATAVCVAAFFVVQIALREPFRGYQTEVSLSGTASPAVDPEALQKWITNADPKVAVAISGGTGSRPQVQVRIGRIGSRLDAARSSLEALARRILIEHLPQADAAHRERVLKRLEQELQLARDSEQDLAARFRDLATSARMAKGTTDASLPADQPTEAVRAINAPSDSIESEIAGKNSPLQSQLEALRLELSRLLANFTEEHPQVVAIRRQIANLEGQMGAAAPATEFDAAAGNDFSHQPPAHSASFTSFPADHMPDANGQPLPSELDAEQDRVSAQLNAAISARQAAERKLHMTLASFSVHAPAAGWTAESPRLVARLGGTPRMLPLLLSSLVALVAGICMFRATSILTGPALLVTTTDLARALPIPLVGQAQSVGKSGRSKLQQWITPARIQLVTRVAEFWIAAILVTCLAAFCLDPSLSSQFVADPLGVWSEIVGRLMGR